MSSSVSADSELVQGLLNQVSNISDVSQLVQGVQNNPDLMLAAIQALVQNKDNAAAELEQAQKRTAILEKQAAKGKRSTADLENVMSQFADALHESKKPRSVMIPDPPIYSGSKEDFNIWKGNMLMKLNVNRDHFSDDQARMVYIYSRLDNRCQAHLHSWVTDGFIKFPSAVDMMETLNVIFHDPNLFRCGSLRSAVMQPLQTTTRTPCTFATWSSII